MPFSLCNAPATFQRCMLAIFHDMIEESVKVFMHDFSVFGNSFDTCLNNLDKMLQHCKDAHLVLNWEKCHFMVKEGIVLGHKVSSTGLEVDKAKIDVISKLPPPTNIKGIRSFLGYAGFYQHFIKDFSKIARPLTKLLQKDPPFEFNGECQKAFESLKEKLTCAPMIVSPNWNLPFELMCDASNFAIGAILEFDIEINDRKGTENVAADHLSRIENDETSDDSEVDENFPGETLMKININGPWFADFTNYLVVAIDYVSKWAEAQTLPTNDAQVVVAFLKKLFCHFGMPKALISDRATHFCNKIMQKTMKRYGVNHRFSTSYHPQTSGQVENINRALKRILEKTVKDNPAIWSRKLDDALWAFRTAYKTPTSTTPYKLIYGKNYHLPFEIEHRAYWALKNYNPDLIAVGNLARRYEKLRCMLKIALPQLCISLCPRKCEECFLYGTIEEEVYVCQPHGFEDPQFPDKVYKVEKFLYGLHQAPRAWYETLSTYLLENGYKRGTIDKNLFIKKDRGDILLVQVYADDIIFGSIKKFDFATVKTASTPIETNKALVKDEEAEAVDVHLYISMIRSLMYVTASRPDIMFVVCACARFQVTPKTSHIHTVKRIFRYLKGQPKLGLWYPRDSPFDLEDFSDSDYAGASLDMKSTTGDETVYKEWEDRMERAVTTASSLDAEQDSVIIEQRVKDDQKARILEHRQRNYEEHCSDNLYAVSIKEDMAYLYLKLHSASTKRRLIRRILTNLYVVSKIKFHTEIREIDRKTQDSGIVVKGEYGEDIIDYYRILQEVLEVKYLGENKRVLVFKCDWFMVYDKKGLQVDRESAAISINVSRKWFKDQPYILASQAKQVFYVPDLKLGKQWYVVESSPHRKLFDVPVHEVYQEHEAHSSVISNYNVEPSSLTRGTIPFELVDA
ncbi:reverse transcriptase domain-containing protein [Tanacetum coccineum]|uniref:Reverse transcriptase domain-containing protein n=1 Tax=Tanacetum coccineum TaxID=301880 RepID=A0ABQ5B1H0_9ASTR